jgi:carboxyl-terminal processing protease
MIRLTTARYYTPTGRSIQKPYEKGNAGTYNREVITRYNKGELTSADSIHFPDSLKYNTLVNHRTVYGGGGIMPDYFVPLDTTRFTDLHRSLIASGTLNKFVMNTIDKNRKTYLKQYSNFDLFKNNFVVGEQMINDLIKLYKEEKEKDSKEKKKSALKEVDKKDDKRIDLEEEPFDFTELDLTQLEKSKPLIKLQIKAMIARDLWNTNEYFQIINSDNDALKKALQIINYPTEYYKLLGKN